MNQYAKYILVLIVMTANLSIFSAEIHIAAQQGDISAMSRLVAQHGSELVNQKLANDITPLHIAAALNNKQIVAFLLATGADIDAKTTSGFTPLHWAANKDARDSAELLIAMGADLDAQSEKGLTPLHWAASQNSTNVVKLLLLSGADIYKTSAKGYKPLHWAVMNEAQDVYPMLLFKETSDSESGSRDTVKSEADLDKVNWSELLAGPNIRSTDSAVALSVPRAKTGSNMEIPLGQDIKMEMVWIDSLKIWFSKYEVTNEQYRQFKPNHSSLFREDLSLNDPSQPAVYLNWKQAKVYCTWLNREYSQRLPEGYEFRLPYEDEWVECARCGTSRRYPWGDTMPPLYGNYSDESLREYTINWKGIKGYNDGFIVSCNVEDSGKNEWGIYGMGGNVWEWCEDWYDTSYRYKCLRGGSWDYDEEHMIRINSRGFDRPDTRDDTIGLRVVAAPKSE